MAGFADVNFIENLTNNFIKNLSIKNADLTGLRKGYTALTRKFAKNFQ